MKRILLPLSLICFFLFIKTNLSAQVLINEFSAANYDQFTDNLGEYEDWIELYNAGSSSVNIGGYFLSDRPDNPLKYQIPAGVTIAAGDHLRIWASGNDSYNGAVIHTNFKITQTRDAEAIIFSDSGGNILDSNTIDVPNKKNHSWARISDGNPIWGIDSNPTPNNTNTSVSQAYATRPLIEPAAGNYSSSVSVSITSPDPDVTIFYTTDGSNPNNGSSIYSGPFTLSATSVVKAIAVSSDNNIPDSHFDVHTYFIDESHTVPIVSISGEGIPNLLGGSTGARPEGYFEFFDANGIRVSDSSGEFNKHGNDSWAYQQRGFDYIARDQFGEDYAVKHQIFPNKTRDKFQRVILKAAANDNYPFAGGAHLRDSYVNQLSQDAGLELDERSNEFCVLYLNGEYWGVYDIREKVDDHDFTKYYYDQGREWIDFIKTWGGTWAEYGSINDWNNLNDFIINNDMTDPANYAYVGTELELMSLIDYMIINTHTVCKDWLNWNTAWWRGRKPSGEAQKWRYTLWDMDATFGHYINYTGVPDVTAYADPCDPEDITTDFEGHVAMLISLLENEDFFAMYINRYADLNNSYLSCDYMIQLLDDMANTIAPEMPGQLDRWGGNYNTWLDKVQEIRDFILIRCDVIDTGIEDCYDVVGPYDIIVDVDPPLAGKVQVNTIIGDNYPWNLSYFGGVDITLTAIENTGYQFSHWTSNNNALSPNNNSITVSTDLASSGNITAHFTVIPCNLDPIIAGPADLCNGDQTELAVTTIFDTYLWSDNSTTQQITVTNPGNYSVTVTDGLGCSATAAYSLGIAPTPSIIIQGADSFCETESTLLDAGSGYTSYLWSDASVDQNLLVTQPGIYNVLVTNAEGCTGMDQIEITELPPPVPIINGATAICEGESTELSLSMNYESYLWNDGSTTPILNVDSQGVFTVIITDASGCTGLAEVEVTQNQSPNPQITGDAFLCNGESTQLNLSETYEAYLWNDNSTNAEIEIDQAGTYSVVITDDNGCTGFAEIEVTMSEEIDAQIIGTTSFCEGSSTTLSLSQNYDSYSWSNNSTNAEIEVDQAGTYSVVITDDNGCTGFAEIEVTMSEEIDAQIIGATSFCEGSSTTLSLSQNYDSYSWSNNSTNAEIEIDQAGTYSVVITDNAGCTGIAEIDVTINEEIDAQIIGATSFCEGSSTTLSLSQNYDSYSWSNNSTNAEIEIDQAGTYSVVITDNSGCTGFAEIEVNISEEIDAQIIGATSFCEGSSTTLSLSQNYDSYSWSNNSTNAEIEINQAGTYSVVITDDTGCTGIAEIEVTVNEEIDAQIIGATSFCEGSSTTLSLSQNYDSYSWSDNSTNAEIEIDQAGTYSVVITDDAGCTGFAEIEVNISEEIDAQIIGATSFCEGSSTTLSLSQNYDSYSWNNNSTNAEIEINQAGTYSVVITDDAGCTGIAEIEVTVNEEIDAQIIGATSFCEGSSTTLSLSQNYDSYSWSDNSTNAEIEIDQAGTYSVVITDDAGCTGFAEIEVNISEEIDAQIIGATSFCEGSSTTLSLSQNYDSYSWSNNSTNAEIEINQAGTYSVVITDDTGCTGIAEIEVTVNEEIDAQIIGATSFCEGSSTTLSLSQNYDSYSWSDNSTNAEIEIDQAGTYSVVITDDAGCTGFAEIEVNISEEIDAQIIGATSFCEGSSTTLSLSQNYDSYSWNNNSTNAEIEVDQAGTYSVIITDDAGCTGIAEIEVNISEEIDAQIIGATSFCEGSSTTLSLSQNYNSYSWSNNSTNAEIEIDQAGIYSVVITDDAGCTGFAEIEVNISEEIDAQIIGATSFCEGSSTTLSLSQNYDSYSWSNNSTNAEIEVDQAGTYSVIITDDAGCTGIAEIEVNISEEIDAQIIGATSFCEGSSTTLSLSQNYDSYSWSDNSTNAEIEIDQAGTYSVVITDDAGCTGIAEIEVNISEEIDAQIIGATSFCEGSSTTLSLSQNYDSYSWSDNSTNAEIDVDQAGTYSVVITDDNGCTGIAEIEINISEEIDAQIIGATSFCEGSSTTLSLSQNYDSYSWSDNSTNAEIDVDQAGTYSVVITDDAGCTGVAEIEVSISEEINAQIIGATSFCEGSSTTLSLSQNYDSYSWNNNSTNAEIEVDQAGTYSVVITDDLGCTGTTELEVTVNTIIQPEIVGPLSFCDGSSTSLVVADIYSAYQWSTGTEAAAINVSNSGNYQVTVTSTDGCTATDAFDISAITTLETSQEFVLCFGESLTVGNSTYDSDGTYTDIMTSVEGCDSIVYTLLEIDQQLLTDEALTICYGGFYQGNSYTQDVTLSSLETSINGCDSTHTVFLSVLNEMTATVYTSSDCGGSGTATVSPFGGTGSYNYLWSNGSTSQTQNNLPAGNYAVTITDNFGCSTMASGFVEPTTGVDLDFEVDPISCYGESDANITSTVVSGTAPFTYEWSTGANSSELNNVTTGVYTLLVTDADGCLFATSITVAEPAILTVDPLSTGTLGNDGTATAFASGGTTPYSYLWEDGQTTTVISGLSIGFYSVTVTDAHGCTAIGEAQVSLPTATKEVSGLTLFEIFPNPGIGLFNMNLELEKAERLSYQVYSIDGNILLNSERVLAKNSFKEVIDLTEEAAGLYIIVLDIGGNKLVRKLVVTR